MKIAACYIRVSTTDQTEYSPDSQLHAIKEYAAAHDYYIPDEYIFADEGISGRTVSKRPAFNRMIGVARQKPKPFDAILLWKFSRFARNRTDAIVYKRLLRDDCGIDVISISESLGEDRGTALILESMFEAMDEYYSINLSTEVKRSMLLKAEKGEVLGPAPFGYRNENKNYAIDEAAAPYVRMIFGEIIAGNSVKAITRKLNELGVRNKRGNLFDVRGVIYIIRNPVYIGMIRWSKDGPLANGQTYRRPPQDDDSLILTQGSFPPLITREQYDRANAMLNERGERQRRGSYDSTRREYALHGLVHCSACGGTLTYVATKNPGMQCHRYSHGKCYTSHYVSLKKLTDAVAIALKQAAATMNFEVTPAFTLQDSSELDALQHLLSSEKKRLVKAREAYELGIDTAEEYRSRKQQITAGIKDAEAKIRTFTDRTVDRTAFRAKILSAVALLEDPTASPAAQNAMLRTIIASITFHRDTFTIDLLFHG